VSAGSRTLPRDRPRLTARAAGLLVVVAILALLTLVPARQFFAQRGRIAELEAKAMRLEQRNDALQRQIADLKDPAELERLARECLGMVRPGEIALVTPDVPSSSDC
jgi:cell division protein FtsB